MLASRLALLGTALFVGLAGAAPALTAEGASLPQIGRYDVFEGDLPWQSSAADPWGQVSADVHLRTPSGRIISIGGFYAAPNDWKFRFAPDEVGRWSWTARVSEGSRFGTFSGGFDVVRGASPGFVRISPWNRFRWTFTNGTPFYPIGLNDCTLPVFDPLKRWGFDGTFRYGRHEGTFTDIDTYMRAYSGAGFDLFRWGPNNCSFTLYDRIDPSGDVFSLEGGANADRLFQTLRRYGFRIELVLFGNQPPFTSDSDASDPAKIAAVERYAKYVVDRYGAYVDFWELMNEANASDSWLTQIGGYVKRVDPYHHPLGTNWERPQLPVIDFGTDHWYQTEDPLQADVVTWDRLRDEAARKYGKPTLVDEQGNSGQNWDATSALRLRLRSWTAFFAESTLVFWNASFAKDYFAGAANVYLGPEERGFVRVLQSYTRGFDPRAVVASAHVSQPGARAYVLRGPRQYGLYLVAAGDHSKPTTGIRVTVGPVRGGLATWIDPSSGRVLARRQVRAGTQTLAVPAFTVDTALKISA